MTHKEFYIWLEGYLHGKLENKHIDITPIVEKMQTVTDERSIGIAKPLTVPIPINPIPSHPYGPKPPFYPGIGTPDWTVRPDQLPYYGTTLDLNKDNQND